jgi:hypothetical protein
MLQTPAGLRINLYSYYTYKTYSPKPCQIAVREFRPLTIIGSIEDSSALFTSHLSASLCFCYQSMLPINVTSVVP